MKKLFILIVTLLWAHSPSVLFAADYDSQDTAHTQFNRGLMYLAGGTAGVPKDTEQAHNWFVKAAKRGDVDAQVTLGLMYMEGTGVSQDYKEAAKWFEQAALQGSTTAQLSLGLLYVRGDGVLQDYAMAHKWWNIAASLGDTDAKGNLDKVSEMMTSAQIAEAQRLAREWVAEHP